MSFEAHVWAMRQDIPPRDKFVLVALADYHNRDAGYAWMKQGTLAKLTGYTRATVNAALRALEEDHRLVVSEERRYKDGRNASKLYRLVGVDQIAASETPVKEQPRVKEVDTAKATRVNEIDTDRVNAVDSVRVKEIDSKNLLTENYLTETQELKHMSSDDDARPSKAISTEQAVTPQQLLDTYNEHRGPLPAALTLNGKRKRALAQIAKAYAHRSPEIITAATRQVATDSFWIERGYGLDILLAGEKYVAKAEAWQQNQHIGGADNRQEAVKRAKLLKLLREQDEQAAARRR